MRCRERCIFCRFGDITPCYPRLFRRDSTRRYPRTPASRRATGEQAHRGAGKRRPQRGGTCLTRSPTTQIMSDHKYRSWPRPCCFVRLALLSRPFRPSPPNTPPSSSAPLLLTATRRPSVEFQGVSGWPAQPILVATVIVWVSQLRARPLPHCRGSSHAPPPPPPGHGLTDRLMTGPPLGGRGLGVPVGRLQPDREAVAHRQCRRSENG